MDSAVKCFTCSSELNGGACEDPFSMSDSNKINYSVEYPDNTICYKRRTHDPKTKTVDGKQPDQDNLGCNLQ